MKIKLTPESAEVLSRVEGLQRWCVDPTMTRGSKKEKDSITAKETGLPKVTKESKSTKKKPGIVHASNPFKKKKIKAPKVKKLETSEISAATIRRTVAGREAIKVLMEKLFESDCNAFGSAPAFSSDGTCRMKFEGAEKFTWDGILSVAPKAIEWMSLATFCSSFLFLNFCSG